MNNSFITPLLHHLHSENIPFPSIRCITNESSALTTVLRRKDSREQRATLRTALPKTLLESTLLAAGVSAVPLRQEVIYLGLVTALSFLSATVSASAGL